MKQIERPKDGQRDIAGEIREREGVLINESDYQ
jgi:hypothetical protein